MNKFSSKSCPISQTEGLTFFVYYIVIVVGLTIFSGKKFGFLFDLFQKNRLKNLKFPSFFRNCLKLSILANMVFS